MPKKITLKEYRGPDNDGMICTATPQVRPVHESIATVASKVALLPAPGHRVAVQDANGQSLGAPPPHALSFLSDFTKNDVSWCIMNVSNMFVILSLQCKCMQCCQTGHQTILPPWLTAAVGQFSYNGGSGEGNGPSVWDMLSEAHATPVKGGAWVRRHVSFALLCFALLCFALLCFPLICFPHCFYVIITCFYISLRPLSQRKAKMHVKRTDRKANIVGFFDDSFWYPWCPVFQRFCISESVWFRDESEALYPFPLSWQSTFFSEKLWQIFSSRVESFKIGVTIFSLQDGV